MDQKGSARLWEMAEECRALAALAKAPEVREQLLEVADQFERFAERRKLSEMTISDRA